MTDTAFFDALETLNKIRDEQNADARKQEQARAAKHEARRAALSQPITAEQHLNFKKHLYPIAHGAGHCWIHVSKATTGRTKTYTRVKFNGVLIPAHRFALAVKLGCTLWQLDGVNAGHAPAWECMGGRCCNLDHLLPETAPAVGAWLRSADQDDNGTKPKRTPEQLQNMVKRMHPRGLPVGDMLLGRIVTHGTGANCFQHRVIETVHTYPKPEGQKVAEMHANHGITLVSGYRWPNHCRGSQW